MPISARSRVMPRARGVDALAVERDRAGSMPSSRLTQRSMVDLPEPDGPAMTIASPR